MENTTTELNNKNEEKYDYFFKQYAFNRKKSKIAFENKPIHSTLKRECGDVLRPRRF